VNNEAKSHRHTLGFFYPGNFIFIGEQIEEHFLVFRVFAKQTVDLTILLFDFFEPILEGNLFALGQLLLGFTITSTLR
jgi:hypothetical protein